MVGIENSIENYMCGFVGYIYKNKHLSDDVFRNMNHSIKYRGPDDEGYFSHSFGEQKIGLAHNRLSILDLSHNGKQPMSFENLTMVYNGEIYNYKEIKSELRNLGYEFESTSDTEVILKSFHKWGRQAVEKFNGMFAIALFDKAKQELLLIRDRIGIKPLYYSFKDNDLTFASELKPIMGSPFFQKKINFYALNLFLHQGYITAPHTIFADTFKLCPGTILTFKDGSIKQDTYWSITEKYLAREVDESLTENKAVDQLDELLKKSVEYRMISDVPFGSFLSGGYDSSLVTATMQELSNAPIHTFSIGFDSPGYDEAVYAKEIAQYLGTHHTEHYFDAREFDDVLRDFVNYYDEPFADSSQLPSILVSRLARKNIKVVLTGDGGDELFCGYNRYAGMLRYKKLEPICKILSQLNKIFPLEKLLGFYGKNWIKLVHLTNNEQIINFDFYSYKAIFEGILKNTNLENDKRYQEILSVSDNLQEANMLRDMKNYLPEDILTKVDRATMSASLEARVPLLDHRIIEYSFNIPHHLKFRNGEKKIILKQLAHKKIPKHFLDRPKKGFQVPIGRWIGKTIEEFSNDLFSKKFIFEQDIFDFEKIKYLLKNANSNSKYPFDTYLWHLIVFQLWYKKYMH